MRLRMHHARRVCALVMVVALTSAACTAEASRPARMPTSTVTPAPNTLQPVEHRLELPEPTPEPTPESTPTYDSPVASISIPAARVFVAPLIPMNVRDGYMDLPYNPYQVAWYDFTAKPGMGGNAVFSAHVDYIRYGPAVFANLHRLSPDDEVVIGLQDGTAIHYTVVSNETVLLGNLDMREVLASTEEDIATLITCGGYFDGHDYSHRIVVVARRTSVVTPQ
ncbi:MAG: class F sortase [Dehalococcoidia bacterium]|nr:class F sortase [Dehalococcoidia bacterium]